VQIIGPDTLTIGVATTFVDPARSGQPSMACQIQNGSSYQLLVNAGGAPLSIQPFWAQTVEISGLPITITPVAASSSAATAPNITLAFLLGTAQGNGEQLPSGTWIEAPPQEDGTLTAEAIASLAGVLTTQGVVDKLGAGNHAIVGGTEQTFPPPGGTTALHSYDTLVLVLEVFTTVTPVTAMAFNDTVTFVPYPSQVQSPIPDINSAAPTAVFFLPVVCAPGDAIGVEVLMAASQTSLQWALFGVTSELTEQVITPVGNPLATAPRGGTLSASATRATAGNATILSAPAAGFAYRLQRLTSSDNTKSCNLFGISSVFLYGSVGPTPALAVDNMEGLISTEALEISTSGAVTGYLFYDLIPVPTIS
jgi:hypothetical protein